MAEPENKEKEQALSQAEVDALVSKDGGEKFGDKTVKPYQFHASAHLSAGKLRRVKNKHEDFGNTLTSALSQFVRADFVVKMTNFETIPHKAMAETLKGPTHIKLIRAEPSMNIALLEVSPKLCMNVVSRLLGAKAFAGKEDRPFTEIEISLLEGFTDVILNSYSSLCRVYEHHWKMVPMENETSAQFLKIAPDSASIFFLTFEGKIGETTGQIRLAIPQQVMDPLIKKITEEIPVDSPSSALPGAQSGGPMVDFPISICARWHGLQLALRDLASLKKDDVLMLDPHIFGKTSLCVGESAKFMGQVGKKGDQRAVRITAST